MTSKQAKAFHNLVENGGNKGKALKDAGYSKAVIKTPGKVFKSKSLQDEIRKQLRLQGSTLKKDIQVFLDAQAAETMDIETGEVKPNHTTRMAATKEILKLKGAYSNDTKITNLNQFNNPTIKINKNATDEELLQATFNKSETNIP